MHLGCHTDSKTQRGIYFQCAIYLLEFESTRSGSCAICYTNCYGKDNSSKTLECLSCRPQTWATYLIRTLIILWKSGLGCSCLYVYLKLIRTSSIVSLTDMDFRRWSSFETIECIRPINLVGVGAYKIFWIYERIFFL